MLSTYAGCLRPLEPTTIESLGGLFKLSNHVIANAWRALIELLGPAACPRCNAQSSDGFCGDCRREFLRIESACPRCGLPSPCRPCAALARDWHLDAVRSPFVYAPPLAHYLQRLKYRRERHLGCEIGRLAAAGLACAADDTDALVAVPLHPKRLRQRTFNQATEIALPIAKLIGRPLLERGIRRALDTQPQTELARSERLRGPRRAFRVDCNLSGLRIAIVDDVITTGATVNALARALRAAGAVEVQAWSVARSTTAK